MTALTLAEMIEKMEELIVSTICPLNLKDCPVCIKKGSSKLYKMLSSTTKKELGDIIVSTVSSLISSKRLLEKSNSSLDTLHAMHDTLKRDYQNMLEFNKTFRTFILPKISPKQLDDLDVRLISTTKGIVIAKWIEWEYKIAIKRDESYIIKKPIHDEAYIGIHLKDISDDRTSCDSLVWSAWTKDGEAKLIPHGISDGHICLGDFLDEGRLTKFDRSNLESIGIAVKEDAPKIGKLLEIINCDSLLTHPPYLNGELTTLVTLLMSNAREEEVSKLFVKSIDVDNELWQETKCKLCKELKSRCSCSVCEGCHNRVNSICSECNYCSDCCDCVRCESCGELLDNCNCVRCNTCNEITDEEDLCSCNRCSNCCDCGLDRMICEKCDNEIRSCTCQ